MVCRRRDRVVRRGRLAVARGAGEGVLSVAVRLVRGRGVRGRVAVAGGAINGTDGRPALGVRGDHPGFHPRPVAVAVGVTAGTGRVVVGRRRLVDQSCAHGREPDVLRPVHMVVVDVDRRVDRSRHGPRVALVAGEAVSRRGDVLVVGGRPLVRGRRVADRLTAPLPVVAVAGKAAGDRSRPCRSVVDVRAPDRVGVAVAVDGAGTAGEVQLPPLVAGKRPRGIRSPRGEVRRPEGPAEGHLCRLVRRHRVVHVGVSVMAEGAGERVPRGVGDPGRARGGGPVVVRRVVVEPVPSRGGDRRVADVANARGGTVPPRLRGAQRALLPGVAVGARASPRPGIVRPVVVVGRPRGPRPDRPGAHVVRPVHVIRSERGRRRHVAERAGVERVRVDRVRPRDQRDTVLGVRSRQCVIVLVAVLVPRRRVVRAELVAGVARNRRRVAAGVPGRGGRRAGTAVPTYGELGVLACGRARQGHGHPARINRVIVHPHADLVAIRDLNRKCGTVMGILLCRTDCGRRIDVGRVIEDRLRPGGTEGYQLQLESVSAVLLQNVNAERNRSDKRIASRRRRCVVDRRVRRDRGRSRGAIRRGGRALAALDRRCPIISARLVGSRSNVRSPPGPKGRTGVHCCIIGRCRERHSYHNRGVVAPPPVGCSHVVGARGSTGGVQPGGRPDGASRGRPRPGPGGLGGHIRGGRRKGVGRRRVELVRGTRAEARAVHRGGGPRCIRDDHPRQCADRERARTEWGDGVHRPRGGGQVAVVHLRLDGPASGRAVRQIQHDEHPFRGGRGDGQTQPGNRVGVVRAAERRRPAELGVRSAVLVR
ncbi:MAG: hypothetical protein WC560_12860, partial [Syntrophales bacterium]